MGCTILLAVDDVILLTLLVLINGAALETATSAEVVVAPTPNLFVALAKLKDMFELAVVVGLANKDICEDGVVNKEVFDVPNMEEVLLSELLSAGFKAD